MSDKLQEFTDQIIAKLHEQDGWHINQKGQEHLKEALRSCLRTQIEQLETRLLALANRLERAADKSDRPTGRVTLRDLLSSVILNTADGKAVGPGTIEQAKLLDVLFSNPEGNDQLLTVSVGRLVRAVDFVQGNH